MDYYIRLTNFYHQFQAIGNNYNQTVRAVKANFGDKRAFALVAKLEKATLELVVLSKQIVALTREFEERHLNRKAEVDMVAKINRGASLYGAVIYNQQKVNEATGRIIAGNRMITDSLYDPDRIVSQTMFAFESYLAANRNTEKPILHISLNPTLDDNLTDSQFADLARAYMQKMGYGNQPYIVYLHEDIDRRHIHIVSTCVNENGEKIDDAYEWNRSMKACRELEQMFGLKQIADKRRELLEPYLKKADYTRGDVKRQVSNILKSVFTSYRFQSFGEYSAMLSCFNIEAKQVKGEFDGKPYSGIIYTMTDDDGKPICTPIKSSLIGKRFGFEGVEKRIAYNAQEFRAKRWQPKIRNDVALAMHGSRGNREEFVRLLGSKGIDVVFRENDAGRIYGVTFIDHHNREVYNGSRLGKEFSANNFEKLFNSQGDIPWADMPQGFSESHSLSSADLESGLEQAFGIFSFDAPANDPQEEMLAKQYQKKRRRKTPFTRHIVNQFH